MFLYVYDILMFYNFDKNISIFCQINSNLHARAHAHARDRDRAHAATGTAARIVDNIIYWMNYGILNRHCYSLFNLFLCIIYNRFRDEMRN